MGAVLGIVILLVVVPYLAGRVSRVRNQPWAGPQTRGMRRRSAKGAPVRSPGKAAAKAARSAGSMITHPSSGQIRAQAKADAYTAWQQAFAADWTEQQRHARANGTVPAGGTATATETRPTFRQRLSRLKPFTPPAPDPASGGGDGTPAGLGGGTPDGGGKDDRPAAAPKPDGGGWTIPPWPGQDPEPVTDDPSTREPYSWERPRQPAPQPDPDPDPGPGPGSGPGPSSTDGGTPVAGSSTASAQKMIEGINEIHAHAQSGGIHAKREAHAAIHEGAVRFSAMVQMLARQMSEPGMNYGHEITEPLAKAGQQFNAGAMAVSEADTALETLVNMTVGDLAKSPRQAPNHQELSENGAR